MHQKRKISLLTILVLAFILIQLNPNKFNSDQKDDSTISSIESAQGVSEIVNFIPNGTDATHFADSSWKYPFSNSYYDSYWGDGSFNTIANEQFSSPPTLQNWNPDNEYYQNQISVRDSVDFNAQNVSSFDLDPVRREREFRTNQSDLVYNLTTTNVPTQTGNLGGSIANSEYFYKSGGNYPSVFKNNFYAGNTEPNGTSYYKSGTSSYVPTLAQYNEYQAGNWINGNNANQMYYGTSPLDIDIQQYMVSHSRDVWYNYYFNYGVQTERVTAKWDVNSTYSSEFRLNFYYENYSIDTHANYGADISFNPRNLAPAALYDFNVFGNVTYELWRLTPTPLKITTYDKAIRFGDDATGTMVGNPSYTSGDFGQSLSQNGWYYLRIVVNINLRLSGESTTTAGNPALNMAAVTGGLDVIVTNPFVKIYESAPISINDKEILMESKDWIYWGENREIISGTDANITFGICVPSELTGANGASGTLTNGLFIARLTIENSSSTTSYTEYGPTFQQVRESNGVWGVGCDKFIWNLNDTIKLNLNNSIRIKLYIGVLITSGLQLKYDSFGEYSRIYFNNIKAIAQTETGITGLFYVLTPNGPLESNYLITISNLDDIFSQSVVSGAAKFDSLYQGTWQIIVNKTISNQNYTLYNASFVLDTATTSFTKNLQINLTNIWFALKDQSDQLITTKPAKVVMKNLLNSETRILDVNTEGYALAQALYDGNWKIYVNTTVNGKDYTVYNSTKLINIVETPYNQQYITNITLNANLTNTELHFVDPTGANFENSLVKFTKIDEPLKIQTATTDANGNITFIELADSSYILAVFKENYVVLNITYVLNTLNDVVYSSYVCNLTNLMLRISGYESVVYNDVTFPTFVQLKRSSSVIKSGYTTENNITFTEIFNSTIESSWQLVVNITAQGQNVNVYNASIPIFTSAHLIYNTITINITNLDLTLYDLDNVIIPNGLVHLYNTVTGYDQWQTSSSEGKVQFLNVYTFGTWGLTINYTLGLGNRIATNYTIYSTSNFLINPTNLNFIYTPPIFNCNLTTLEFFTLKESDSSPLFAKVYIQNISSGLNLTEIQTDGLGYAKIRLPATSYSFKVFYSQVFRTFYFNDTGDLTPTLSKTKLINHAQISNVSVDLDLTVLELSVYSSMFANPSWPHINQTTEITMYYGDTLALTLEYRDYLAKTPIVGDASGNWTIETLTNWLNGSNSLVANFHDSSFYTFYFASTNYGVGTYYFSVNKYSTNPGLYYDTQFDLKIRVLSVSTRLEQISPQANLVKQWSQSIAIQVNLTTVLPEIGIIPSAVLTFTLDHENIAESFSYSAGLYTLNLNTTQLNVGNYYLTLSYSTANYDTATLTILFTINNLQTETTNLIDPLYKVATNSLKVSTNENISIAFNYTISYNYTAINDAQILGYIDSPINNITIDSLGSSTWQHQINVNATNYSIGKHLIYIICTRTNLQSQTLTIELEIIDSWGTSLQLVSPPNYCIWGDNATFIVNYYITESPRSSQEIKLDQATITQLNLTYLSESQEIQRRILLPEETSIWRYENKGDGNYQIWFNTSILEISLRSVFYAIPTFTMYNYDTSIIKPYVWLDPLSATITLTSNSQTINYLDLYKNDGQLIIANLTVSQSSSLLDKKQLEGAQLRYYVYNGSKEPSKLIATDELDEMENGLYNFSLYASFIGNFSLDLLMTYANHSLAVPVSIPLRITLRPVSFGISIDSDFRISSTSMKVAYGENITFHVNFLEEMTVYPTLDIKIGGQSVNAYYQENGIYLCTDYASKFPNGTQQIQITSKLTGAKDYNQTIDINIMPSWKTTLEIIQPPTLYPWNNISSFIVKYSCVEDPRYGVPLAKANITALNITQIQGGKEQLFRSLTTDTLGVYWNWTDLKLTEGYGEGYYQIQLNTSIFTITQRTLYYLIPIINYSVFEQAFVRPYIWVSPVETTIIPIATLGQTQINNSYSCYLDQSLTFYAYYWATDELSVLKDQKLSNADVYCEVYVQSEAHDLIDTIVLINSGNGYYELNFKATRLGKFELVIYASYTNYTSVETTAYIDVSKKPIIANTTTQSFAVPQNRPFTMALSVRDPVHDSVLTSANVYLMIDENKYTFTWNETSQQYELAFTQEILDSFIQGNYDGLIYVEKENYTMAPIPVALYIGLPVDPYLNVPYQYWLIIGVTIAAMIGFIVTQQAIKNARIPLILKQIDKTRKLIHGKKEVPDGNISLSTVDEMIERYANKWKILDLNLASILKPSNKEPRDGAFTDADKPVENTEEGGN